MIGRSTLTFLLIDDAVENHRFIDLDHFPNLVVELAGMFAADAVGVIGLGELDEIRQRFGVGMRIAAERLRAE